MRDIVVDNSDINDMLTCLFLTQVFESELRDDEVWKLNKALYGYRKAPKLWHQHVLSLLEGLSCHPLRVVSEMMI